MGTRHYYYKPFQLAETMMFGVVCVGPEQSHVPQMPSCPSCPESR